MDIIISANVFQLLLDALAFDTTALALISKNDGCPRTILIDLFIRKLENGRDSRVTVRTLGPQAISS